MRDPRLLLLLPLAVLWTWPWPATPTALLGVPDVETAEHLWALWLGLDHGLVIETELIEGGYRWVLADPLNLPWFAAGAWIDPAIGWGFVWMGQLVVAGLGAAALSAATGHGEPWLAALFGATVPALASGLSTGMSDGSGVGWVALGLAALWWAQDGGWGRLALAGVALGLTAWAGPYMLLFAALCAPFFVRSWRAVAALPVAAAVAWPVLAAIGSRPAGAPGTEDVLAMALADPDGLGALLNGAPLPALVWPVDGRLEAVLLGVVPIGLALWGRHRRLGLAAAWCAVLSLGFFVQLDDAPVRIGDRLLTLPAAWLGMASDTLARASRWTRAAALAGLLLAPLAAAGAAKSSRWLWLAALVESLAHSPWPRTLWEVPELAGYEELEGPILHLPPARDALQRKLRLVHQTRHGLVLAENPHQASTQHRAERWGQALMRSAAAGREPPPAPDELRTVVLLRGDRREEAWLERALGPPSVSTDDLLAWPTSGR